MAALPTALMVFAHIVPGGNLDRSEPYHQGGNDQFGPKHAGDWHGRRGSDFCIWNSCALLAVAKNKKADSEMIGYAEQTPLYVGQGRVNYGGSTCMYYMNTLTHRVNRNTYVLHCWKLRSFAVANMSIYSIFPYLFTWWCYVCFHATINSGKIYTCKCVFMHESLERADESRDDHIAM